MKTLSLRARLTVWYFVVLAITFCLFATVIFEEMRRSTMASVDDELRGRIRGSQQLLENELAGDFSAVLLRHGGAADLLQISDEQGNLVYRAPMIVKYGLAMPKVHPGEWRLATQRTEAGRVRILTAGVRIQSQDYQVQAAIPLAGYDRAVERFGWAMLISIPVLLALASAGGYWLSRRALAPVDDIAARARVISEQNLSSRLPVPASQDELQRLVETLNAMLERLEGAFQRITQFTADASHELRTPLALIRTTAEVCHRHPRTQDEYRAGFALIVSEVQKTTELVEELLLLARADAGSESIPRAPIDLAAVLRETCERGRVMAEAKQLRFDADLRGAAVRVMGSREALHRLFMVLIDNAVKYTAAGGHVWVQTRTAESAVVTTVNDTGIGIAESDLPHIFERFYRADKARSSGGFGLGLSIGQWIAAAHRGSITCRSSVGAGSAFEVVLPLAAPLSTAEERRLADHAQPVE